MTTTPRAGMTHHQAAEANIAEVLNAVQRIASKTMTTDQATAAYLANIAQSAAAAAQAFLALNETLMGIRGSLTEQPVGACTGDRVYELAGDLVRSPCVYGHNHTGAHRDRHGVTWLTDPEQP